MKEDDMIDLVNDIVDWIYTLSDLNEEKIKDFEENFKDRIGDLDEN